MGYWEHHSNYNDQDGYWFKVIMLACTFAQFHVNMCRHGMMTGTDSSGSGGATANTLGSQ